MQTYLLQNLTAGYIGNSPVFWHKNNNSYTQWINDAKEFTLQEAEEIIKTTTGTQWRIWPTQLIHKKAKLTTDIQDLPPQEQIDNCKEWINHDPEITAQILNNTQ